jgi:hypothetical protein
VVFPGFFADLVPYLLLFEAVLRHYATGLLVVLDQSILPIAGVVGGVGRHSFCDLQL